MRVAVIGAGVTGLVAAQRLTDAGHETDVYERWPGLGGQVATMDVGDGDLPRALLPPPVHQRRPHLRALRGARDGGRDRVAALERRDVRARPDLPVHDPDGPAALQAAVAALEDPHRLRNPAPAAVATASRAGSAGTTARDWIVANMGQQVWDELWGPLLRGKFGDRAEDISMAWLWSKLTLRRRADAAGGPAGDARVSARRLPAAARAAARTDRALGAGADRPPGGGCRARAGRLQRLLGSAGFVSPRARPARIRAAAASETYDAVIATVPNPNLQAAPRSRARAARRRRIPGHGSTRSPTTPRSACCSSSTGRSARTTGPTSPTRAPVRRPDRADEPGLAGALRRSPLPLRRQLPAPGRPAARPRLRGAARRLRARPARGQPGVRARLGRRSWLFREPDAQPIVDLGYADRMPPLETGVPGLILANTTQIYPEDRGTNYSVRLGTDAVAALEASLR